MDRLTTSCMFGFVALALAGQMVRGHPGHHGPPCESALDCDEGEECRTLDLPPGSPPGGGQGRPRSFSKCVRPCTVDADCPLGSDTSEAGEECRDVPKAGGSICVKRGKPRHCQQNSDCPTGQECRMRQGRGDRARGWCVTPCTSHDQCAASQACAATPHGSSSLGKICIPERMVHCNASADCRSFQCVEGRCGRCQTDAQCTGSSAFPVCGIASGCTYGQCAACTEAGGSSPCPAGSSCSLVGPPFCDRLGFPGRGSPGGDRGPGPNGGRGNNPRFGGGGGRRHHGRHSFTCQPDDAE